MSLILLKKMKMDTLRKLLQRNVHNRRPGALNPSLNLIPTLKYQPLAFSELHLWTRWYSEHSVETFLSGLDFSPLEREQGGEDGVGEWQRPDSKPELSDAGPVFTPTLTAHGHRRPQEEGIHSLSALCAPATQSAPCGPAHPGP